MELTKITRSKSFEMTNGFGLKIWDKIGAEMSINPTDDPKQGYKTMDDLIEEVHKESYKEFSIVADNVPVPEVQVTKTPLQSMIEAITTCTEVSTLKTFEKLAKSKPEFQKAYDNRLKELQQ